MLETYWEIIIIINSVVLRSQLLFSSEYWLYSLRNTVVVTANDIFHLFDIEFNTLGYLNNAGKINLVIIDYRGNLKEH
jgi:hypothetical protein